MEMDGGIQDGAPCPCHPRVQGVHSLFNGNWRERLIETPERGERKERMRRMGDGRGCQEAYSNLATSKCMPSGRPWK